MIRRVTYTVHFSLAKLNVHLLWAVLLLFTILFVAFIACDSFTSQIANFITHDTCMVLSVGRRSYCAVSGSSITDINTFRSNWLTITVQRINGDENCRRRSIISIILWRVKISGDTIYYIQDTKALNKPSLRHCRSMCTTRGECGHKQTTYLRRETRIPMSPVWATDCLEKTMTRCFQKLRL